MFRRAKQLVDLLSKTDKKQFKNTKEEAEEHIKSGPVGSVALYQDPKKKNTLVALFKTDKGTETTNLSFEAKKDELTVKDGNKKLDYGSGELPSFTQHAQQTDAAKSALSKLIGNTQGNEALTRTSKKEGESPYKIAWDPDKPGNFSVTNPAAKDGFKVNYELNKKNEHLPSNVSGNEKDKAETIKKAAEILTKIISSPQNQPTQPVSAPPRRPPPPAPSGKSTAEKEEKENQAPTPRPSAEQTHFNLDDVKKRAEQLGLTQPSASSQANSQAARPAGQRYGSLNDVYKEAEKRGHTPTQDAQTANKKPDVIYGSLSEVTKNHQNAGYAIARDKETPQASSTPSSGAKEGAGSGSLPPSRRSQTSERFANSYNGQQKTPLQKQNADATPSPERTPQRSKLDTRMPTTPKPGR